MKSTVCLHFQDDEDWAPETKKKNTKKNVNIKQEFSGDEGDLDQDSFDDEILDEIEVKKHLKVYIYKYLGWENSRIFAIFDDIFFSKSSLFTYIFKHEF